MEIDKMILEANKDGKFYVNTHDGYEYQRDIGFASPKGKCKLTIQQGCWEEKPKRCISISEAEKELDCEIKVDIAGLLKTPNEKPKEFYNVIVIYDIFKESYYTGFYSSAGEWWVIGEDGACLPRVPLFWIDPNDISKLLPKQG